MTGSGIVLPETAREKPLEGEVLAVGPGYQGREKRIPMNVKEGDRVLFAKYAGTEIELGTGKVLILKESNILAIVK